VSSPFAHVYTSSMHWCIQKERQSSHATFQTVATITIYYTEQSRQTCSKLQNLLSSAAKFSRLNIQASQGRLCSWRNSWISLY